MIKKLILLSLVLTSCSDQSPSIITKEPIKDVTTLSQDISSYAPAMALAKTLPTSTYETSKLAFFDPWICEEFVYPKNVITQYSNTFANGWGENLMPRDASWFEKNTKNSNYDAYQSLKIPAIITQNTSMRTFPTNLPHFNNPEKAGQGYPFDNMQAMNLYCGTPVIISHYCADKTWAFIQTNSKAFGWVDVRHVAKVSFHQKKELMGMKWGAALKENEPIYQSNGTFYDQAKLGMLLPMHANGDVILPKRDDHGNLNITSVTKKIQISKKPLEFNPSNITLLANQLIGNAYGWGDSLGNRDCASTTKDFFAPFGIWLARNAKSQMESQGTSHAVDKMSQREKLDFIAKNAVPFQTLLYQPGHVGIYIGQSEQGPLMLHNVWGNRTTVAPGKDGRNIIGKTIISTLKFGQELPHFNKESGTFLKKMTIVKILSSDASG
jgi:hypothetical protein